MGKLVGLAHIGIYVKDIERSREFYEKLGFTYKDKYEVNGATHLLFMTAGTCELELILHPCDRVAGPIDHLAVEVENIEELYEGLKAMNVKMVSNGIDTVPGLLGGIKALFFEGPDGERIEYFQYIRS